MKSIPLSQPTRFLAEWAAEVPSQWPSEVLALAAHELEDTVASIVAGAGDHGPASVRATLSEGSVPVVGSTRRASPYCAAVANGTAAHSREVDEMYLAGLGHFGVAVVPALMSIGHVIDAGLDDLLDAIIVSSEVIGRLGLAMNRPHVVRGWHGTSTMGALAAAVACGRLLKFDAETMGHALSISASRASGLVGQFGTNVKPLQAGFAAEAGVRAARAAAAGVTGNLDILEAASGFDHLYRGDVPQDDPGAPVVRSAADWSRLVGIGEPLVILSHGLVFKAYPNCMSTHRALDAFLSLKRQHRFTADDVETIDTYVGKVNLVNLKHHAPTTIREAQFSMEYAIATANLYGKVGLGHFTPAAVLRDEVQQWMRRVSMSLTPGAGAETIETVRPHKVVVCLKSGKKLEAEVLFPTGDSKQNPFDARARRGKFLDCCEGILPQLQLEKVWAMLQAPLGCKLRPLMEALSFDAKVDDGERFIR